MAVLNGKLYFSWVQRSQPCIPDATRKTATSKWQLAIGQTQPCKLTFVFLRALCGRWFSVFSVPPRLRGELLFQNGGLR
jgi:hypothetical protein